MKATKEYYLKLRNFFINHGFITEVNILDNHFELTFLYNKQGKIIRIL